MKQLPRPAFSLYLLLCLAPLAHPQCVPDIPRAAMTDIRHSVAASGFSSALIANPQPVAPVVFSETVPGAPGFWVGTDFHVLYPVPMEYLARSISDLDRQQEFCPHVTLSMNLCPNTEEPKYLRHLQKISVDYVIYKTEFSLLLDGYLETLPDGNGYVLDFKLARRLSGSMSYCAGSWYLKPVVLEGRMYTYARYYTVACVQDLPGIVKFAMRTFPGIEVPATMNSFYRHALALRSADGK